MREPSVKRDGKCREFKCRITTCLPSLGKRSEHSQESTAGKALLYYFSCELGPGRLQITCTPLTIVDPEGHQLVKSPLMPASDVALCADEGH